MSLTISKMDAEKFFIEEFIEAYKSHPALWDVGSPIYVARSKREEAYQSLVKIMRKYKNDATKDDVKKKINIMRSSYGRELRKIKCSDASYKPTLWWFEKFRFIKQVDKHNDDKNKDDNKSNDEKQNVEKPFYYVIGNPGGRNYDRFSESYEMPRVVNEDSSGLEDDGKQILGPNEVETNASSYQPTYMPRNDDTYDHQAIVWANKIRDMEPTQRILAERAINEVIYLGQMGLLTPQPVPLYNHSQAEFYNNYNHQNGFGGHSDNERLTSFKSDD